MKWCKTMIISEYRSMTTYLWYSILLNFTWMYITCFDIQLLIDKSKRKKFAIKKNDILSIIIWNTIKNIIYEKLMLFITQIVVSDALFCLELFYSMSHTGNTKKSEFEFHLSITLIVYLLHFSLLWIYLIINEYWISQ